MVTWCDLLKFINAMKSSFCPLYSFTFKIFKGGFCFFIFRYLRNFNKSLSSVSFQQLLYQLWVNPYWKKSNFDTDILNNYRHISFLAKVLGKVLYSQQIAFVNVHFLFGKFLVWFSHSSLYKNFSSLSWYRLWNCFGGGLPLCCIWYSWPAFNTVDHSIFIDRNRKLYRCDRDSFRLV